MDKNTLSNYGWIVIAVLVLSVMIALATPFGKYIENGVRSTTAGLFDTSEKAMNVVGMSAGSGNFEDGYTGVGSSVTSTPNPALNPSGTIPEGATYTIKATGDILSAGGTFSESVADGDIYKYGDYKYIYRTSSNGWEVSIDVNVTNKKQAEYGAILESINNESITNVSSTFNLCTNLTTAPAIPRSVTYMKYTFKGCTSLTTAPAIPSGVTNMQGTFSGCTSLTTAPVIPSGVINMGETFYGCSSLTTAPTIPSGVTNLYQTFSGCTSLTTAPVIPSGVTNMGETFKGCTSLTTAPVIPSGVTNMGETFYGCSSLTTAPTIPSGVTNMMGTFSGCTSLTGTITINATPTSILSTLKNTQITEILGDCPDDIKTEILATK